MLSTYKVIYANGKIKYVKECTFVESLTFFKYIKDEIDMYKCKDPNDANV